MDEGGADTCLRPVEQRELIGELRQELVTAQHTIERLRAALEEARMRISRLETSERPDERADCGESEPAAPKEDMIDLFLRFSGRG